MDEKILPALADNHRSTHDAIRRAPMPRVETVTCDTCGRDLATTGNSIDYRIAVLNQRIPSWGGVVTDMMIYPCLPGDLYFCGLRCLKAWAEKL